MAIGIGMLHGNHSQMSPGGIDHVDSFVLESDVAFAVCSGFVIP